MIIYVFLRNIFGEMGSSAPIFQHMWKLDNLVMTVPVLIIFKNYFLLIFDHFLLVMLLLIFKSLLRVVAWKCQIVKMWSFLQEQGAVKILLFLFSSTKWSSAPYYPLSSYAKFVRTRTYVRTYVRTKWMIHNLFWNFLKNTGNFIVLNCCLHLDTKNKTAKS